MQVVHLGIRKTGTSSFQKTIKSAFEAGQGILDGKPLIARWVRENSDKNDADYAALEAILAQGQGKHAIFSHEGLAFYDQNELANAIGRALPEAKILLTLRAPNSFLLSQYKYGTRVGRTLSPQRFSKGYTQNTLLKLLDIRRYLNAYGNANSLNPLTILPYEWQLEDNGAYLAFMSTFTGIDFVKFRPDYQDKKSPDLQFTELNRQLNLRLSKEAPEVLDSLLYRRFVAMASSAAAHLPEFSEYFGHFYDDLDLNHDEPKVPDDLWPRMREGLVPLHEIEVFTPYLSEYGLVTEQKEPH